MRSLLSVALALSLCSPPAAAPRQESLHVASADLFTRRYAASPLSSWNLRAAAAGPRCDVLRLEVDVVLETAMVQALHFGEGVYDVYGGGVRQFAGERQFRGVAYLDRTGKLWKFGDVPESLEPCRG